MKKIFAIFIVVFMLSSTLTGCLKYNIDTDGGELSGGNINGNDGSDQKTDDNEKTDDTIINTDTTDKNDPTPEIGEENPDNNEVNTQNNEGNTENNEGSTDTNDDSVVAPMVGTNVGDLIRNVELQRVDGGSVSLEEFRGRIVILNIWATWCPPCRMELPDFDMIASEYSGEVTVIAAHTPSGAANAPEYVESYFPNSKIIFAYDNANYDAYLAAGGYESIPRTVVIDRNGVILYGQDGLMTHNQLISIIEAAK